MDHRQLGQTGLAVSPIGFGAFKIGRNEGIKYPMGYQLPSEEEASELLNGVLDLGINLIDTAPAYGLSEERIGQSISHRRGEFVLSSKVGETFEDGRSTYDFSLGAIEASVQRSLKRLQTDRLDILLLHSNGHDLDILERTDAVEGLLAAKESGDTRFVGLSGKTVEGARSALGWADVLMVEYNVVDQSHEAIVEEACEAAVGVLVKKGLKSGSIGATEAIGFVLGNAAVSSLVVGGLNLEHIRANCLRAAHIND